MSDEQSERGGLVQTGFCIGGRHRDCPGVGIGGLAGPCECTCHGSDECDECDGSGSYVIDGEPQPCICSEPQDDGVADGI